MTIHRFIIDSSQVDREGGRVKLVDPRQVKQLTRVLRLEKGDRIDVVDENGTLYELNIDSFSNKQVDARISKVHEEIDSDSRPFRITVVLPLLKGGNFESALQKLTEIGVDTIIPVSTERTIVKVDGERAPKADEKLRRWMSILKESTEQCERTRPPQIVSVRPLEKALNDLRRADNSGFTFICVERSQAPHLVTTVYSRRFGEASPAVAPSDISIVIGPEGGFSEQEIDQAISLGCIPCSLGGNILRSETAAIVAASLVASFGEISGSPPKYSIE
ncbi:16S rRNA (uracil(1498)-N(3))-methyltransferase [Candidatus Obscuribacterales bacterium]|nr:16S rRNA (uracil(1498)-N(3))-methyltransferase [Candidatus Obscuribacterales bacterium]MBX3148819.1 16S rRNA (uracil(1498)-N(3))-methyltransferase [Candidatus Obscuribacterales bacterium]